MFSTAPHSRKKDGGRRKESRKYEVRGTRYEAEVGGRKSKVQGDKVVSCRLPTEGAAEVSVAGDEMDEGRREAASEVALLESGEELAGPFEGRNLDITASDLPG